VVSTSSAFTRTFLPLHARCLRQFSTYFLHSDNYLDQHRNVPQRNRPGTSAWSVQNLLDVSDIASKPSLPSYYTARPDFKTNLSSENTPPMAHLTSNLKPPKMGPTAGRSVRVSADLAQAFMGLKSIIQQNRVRQDFARQRFYERPGLKAKRLKSERYRRRFKEGFKRMVSVVLNMKKKGM
jgi:ribosomal protein S21